MLHRPPIARLSFGLVMLTVATLLLSDVLGLMPDINSIELDSRKSIAESLAVQLSSEMTEGRRDVAARVLGALVARNDSVRSAAIRRPNGALLAGAGDHERYWHLSAGNKSTPTQVRASIYNGSTLWGTMELSFTELGERGEQLFPWSPFTTVVVFVALVGFLCYHIFLRRALRQLNPNSVIPERVQGALDTLTEGLLVLDSQEQIVYANSAFARSTGLPPKVLVGKKASELGWETNGGDSETIELPWQSVFRTEESATSAQFKLKTELKDVYTFVINASPIIGPGGNVRGALVTFSDITELEVKDGELQRTLGRLEQSQLEIRRQNQELQVLATRDALTGVLNRRSLFDGVQALFIEAQEEGHGLSCIMADIDHFKSVNDRFGHAIGDDVIKLVAGVLSDTVRSSDLVGRYGGEEFCVALPGVGLEAASAIAERMRLAVLHACAARLNSASPVTASFGVSSLANVGVRDPSELIDCADKALHVARKSGRNCVVNFSPTLASDDSTEALVDSTDPTSAADERDSASRAPAETAPQIVDDDRECVESPAALKQQIQQLQQALRESAHYANRPTDATTGLPNRVLLFDRIMQAVERARRHDGNVAVLALHVATLQRINDALGHTAGEKFITSAAARLKRTLRGIDTVAVRSKNEPSFAVSRLGSDELVIVLPDLKEIEPVSRIVKRLFDGLREPIVIEGNEVYMSTSIGVSMFPHDGQEPATLVSHACGAMREAKRSMTHNDYRFYSDDIDERLKKQIRLEGELRHATERGELVLHYQPKLSLKTGRITGMEALVRWQHPQMGIVPPSDFIPLAEQTGVIDAIGEWVIGAACRQAKVWKDAGYGDLSIAVNLSPTQFRREDLASRIIALVEEAGISPSALELEITERVMMQNMDAAIAIMKELNNLGVRASIDDFGTGYASLNSLKHLPVDTLKIDRSFVMGLTENSDDAALMSGIIAMAQSLGLKVVAEGVETEEQLWFLRDLHCNEIQGYFISPPVPRDGATKLLTGKTSVQHRIMAGERDAAAGDSVPGARPEMVGLLNDVSTIGRRFAGQQSEAVGV